MNELFLAGLSVFGIVGWLLYMKERKRSRDYATDLAQVLHDYPEATDSLRRSLQWDEIQKWVNNSDE